MKRNNKKGFTIVELVIVIAVIAILSAVLIPTFGTVISDANKSSAQLQAKNQLTADMAADLADDQQYNNSNDVDGLTYDENGAVTSYTYTGYEGYTVTFDGSEWTVEAN